MARETGVYRRPDSGLLWINATLPNGKRIRQSAGTEDRKEAEAYLAKLKHEAYLESYLGVKSKRSWQEAVVRYLEIKSCLKDIANQRRKCVLLHPFLGNLMLNDITGDVLWHFCQSQFRKGNKPATINRYLALIRSILRMARDEWQWLDFIPKIRLLPGEVERDRWLTREEADRLIAACPPHLAALVRYALATGCRAREITGLEWNRVDLNRGTAWLDHTKNGTPRGVPLNTDAIAVLEGQIGIDPRYCFTFRGKTIRWGLTNKIWKATLKKAELENFRFHDLRHTWASWHRQAGTSCDELKELGGWKSRNMVDRYAKYATEHLAVAASRIELGRRENVVELSRFRHVEKQKA